VFKKAPRLSSTPVWSTRAGASAGGGATSSPFSLGLNDASRTRSDAEPVATLFAMKNNTVMNFV
jgi:hypothetical protein